MNSARRPEAVPRGRPRRPAPVRLRLPARPPARPTPWPVEASSPVVVVCPAYNEEAAVGDVVARVPGSVDGRSVITLVIDDGSTDATGARARQAGGVVRTQPRNRGLGAALRRGLAEAGAYRPAAVVYLDADGEYAPEQITRLAGPVLSGAADYVVGSRFAGRIHRMLPHRRFGNRLLTRWLRWLARRPDVSDGQSGYRAFSPAAAAHAEVIHDYNYAQVLTLDLLGKGYRYAEVPISYGFRDSGTSFIRLGRYLRTVVPAVHRELNAPAGPPPEPPEPPHGNSSAMSYCKESRDRTRTGHRKGNSVSESPGTVRHAGAPRRALSYGTTDVVTAYGLGLHHVQLAMPPGTEDQGRAFYVDVLGMTELQKPPVLAARGGLWVRADKLEIHLGVKVDFRPARKAHPGIQVADIDALAERLTDKGVEIHWDDNFPGYRRFYTADCYGNRLEFMSPIDT